MVRIDRRSGQRVYGAWPTNDPRAAIIWEAFKPESEPRRAIERAAVETNARRAGPAAGPAAGDRRRQRLLAKRGRDLLGCA